LFGEFVRDSFLPFYARKWKASTKVTNDNRILVHLVSEFDSDPLRAIQRDALKAVLDKKAAENKTPLFKENCWRRHILPKLEKVGLAWVNFQVMRRTHATLMKGLGIDGKLVADQLGHGLDVSQNVYTQSPVEHRLHAVNELEKSLQVMCLAPRSGD
jgi:integrase